MRENKKKDILNSLMIFFGGFNIGIGTVIYSTPFNLLTILGAALIIFGAYGQGILTERIKWEGEENYE